MGIININALAGVSPELDALTDRQRAALLKVVFCYRLCALSATAVFNDSEVLREVAEHSPDKIALANIRRFGVDLGSLAMGEPRSYVVGDEPRTLLLGFRYLATGALAEWKRYRQDPDDKHRVLIDRYGSDDRVISVAEVETRGWARAMEGAGRAGEDGHISRDALDLSRQRGQGSVLFEAAACLSLSDLFASGGPGEFNDLY
ncbi:hypothetical protein [Sulfitobacter sp. 1A12779]|uniref:hypothetical protein n=1 Tax=Sulfitobacter sp. 1A12779 TaxID=3368599 RepID=UPI003745F607